MSCKAEIIVEQHPEATYVPVQAVLRIGGRPTVYIVKGKDLSRRNVEIGLDNNRMVLIVSGLEPGEVVSLTPPLAAAALEPTEYSDEIKTDAIAVRADTKVTSEVTGGGISPEGSPPGGDVPRGRVDGEGLAEGPPASSGPSESSRAPRNLSPEQEKKRRQFLESLSPQERERFQNMSPEERRRFRQERMGRS